MAVALFILLSFLPSFFVEESFGQFLCPFMFICKCVKLKGSLLYTDGIDGHAVSIAVIRNMEKSVFVLAPVDVEPAYQIAHGMRACWGNVSHSYLSDTDAVDPC